MFVMVVPQFKPKYELRGTFFCGYLKHKREMEKQTLENGQGCVKTSMFKGRDAQ
jgi:hypothetical protein